MKLEIMYNGNTLDTGFGIWILSKIQNEFISSLDSRKLINWDKLFNSDTSPYKLVYKDGIFSTRNALILGIYSLSCYTLADRVVIKFNPNQFIAGLDHVTVDQFFRTISFGTQEIQGYPLLINILKDISENVDQYVKTYKERRV